jgi:carboxypeptidase family protein
MGTILRMMTKRKKTKKKRFEPLFDFFQHRLSPSGRLTSVRLTIVFIGLIWLAGAACGFEPAARAQDASGSRPRVFVIFATVFNEQGFAFPGARARVRRSDQKKFRWEGMSDHQGEVAFRVPPGAEYELVIEARGFKTETRKIDAQQDNQADLTIRMQPQSASHTGPKTETDAGGKP